MLEYAPTLFDVICLRYLLYIMAFIRMTVYDSMPLNRVKRVQNIFEKQGRSLVPREPLENTGLGFGV